MPGVVCGAGTVSRTRGIGSCGAYGSLQRPARLGVLREAGQEGCAYREGRAPDAENPSITRFSSDRSTGRSQ
nr:hypothetical protein [Streptomyces tsukubensis NRRL18488]